MATKCAVASSENGLCHMTGENDGRFVGTLHCGAFILMESPVVITRSFTLKAHIYAAEVKLTL